VISAATHAIRAIAPHAAAATPALARTTAAHSTTTAPATVATAFSAPAVATTSTTHGERDPEIALGEGKPEVSEERHGGQRDDGDDEVSQSRLHGFLL